MKKSIFTLAIVAVFAACNSTPKPGDVSTTTTNTLPDLTAGDTAGAGQFEQWKEQQKNIAIEGVTENTDAPQMAAAQQKVTAAPATRIIYRDRPASTRRVARTTETKTYGTPANSTRDAVSRNDAGTSNSGNVDASVAGTGSAVGAGTGASTDPVVTAPAEVPEVAKKKGWSKAAKGTAIGAGSGAVLGAIISKNKGKGAVIGGIIGAAGGYVLGKKQDNKTSDFSY
ncbi:MAG TPA: YMGG-like glycine zipper-containing protein [Segetibacter sp.]